jgi:outer membrane protein OmpA-like peptidoglycan-associated protein
MLMRSTALGALLAMAACGGHMSTGPAPEKPGKVVVTDTLVEILHPVTYDAADAITPESYPALDAVVSTLDGNPNLKKVEIQVSFTDGDAATRQTHADKRAKAVMDYLISKAISAGRLSSAGLTTPSPDKTNPTAFLALERAN